jgi:hypothetical protein
MPRLDRDVIGKLTEVELTRPQRDRLGGRLQQFGGLVLSPGSARVTVDKAGQTSRSEPFHRVGTGVASR